MCHAHRTDNAWSRLWLLASVAILSACSAEKAPPVPPAEIEVVEVVKRDTVITQDFVGQTRGSTDIPIRARVEGFLESRHFREGGEVEKGQLLYVIDQRPYRTRVVEAEGRLAESQTLLAKARADLARIQPLAEMKAVRQQDLDASVAQRDAALGALQASEAQLPSAPEERSDGEHFVDICRIHLHACTCTCTCVRNGM